MSTVNMKGSPSPSSSGEDDIVSIPVDVKFASAVEKATFFMAERMCDLKPRCLEAFHIYGPERQRAYDVEWFYAGLPVKVPIESMLVEAVSAHASSGMKKMVAKLVRVPEAMEEVVEEVVEVDQEEKMEVDEEPVLRSPTEEEIDVLTSPSFMFGGEQVYLRENDLRNKLPWREGSVSKSDIKEFRYGLPTNKVALWSGNSVVKFVVLWDWSKRGDVMYEPLKFPMPRLRDIRSHNALIAIHEYREIAKYLKKPKHCFLDAYFNYAVMPKPGSFMSREARHLYHARQRCDYNGVYIPNLNEEDQNVLYHLNLHPRETSKRLLMFAHQILEAPKGKSGEASRSTIWKDGTLNSPADSEVKSLRERFPNSACFWQDEPRPVNL